MKFILSFLLVFSLLIFQPPRANSQVQSEFPKREFRGVWIATVVNIDWPSKAGLSTAEQKRELTEIFDSHYEAGINAVFFQVRPSADAFYAKSREPWSRFLTGIAGQRPEPFYDPLSFAIQLAHERGMELHAWFNPYRATFDLKSSNVSADHITKSRPDWFFQYSNRLLFNPGIPEVRAYITEVIMDVVRNYDIDGVHFDDYFYPYPDKNQLPDQATFRKYGGNFTSIEDWRRNNVDVLIESISKQIHAEKKYVKFGVSPFGIWENKDKHPMGSETSGFSGYRQLYADARLWVEKGWVDYINPQLYFPFNYRAAAFEVLLDWWSKHSFGKHVYVGQAAYRVNESGQGWSDRNQLPMQVRHIRENPRVQGSVFFSSKSLTSNLGNFRVKLKNDLYRYKSLPPAMLWIDSVPPLAPRGLTLRGKKNVGVTLHWQKPQPAKDGESAYGYVVYRSEAESGIDLNDPSQIIHISYDASRSTFTDETAQNGVQYTYAVTSLDRMKNESEPSGAKRYTVKRQ